MKKGCFLCLFFLNASCNILGPKKQNHLSNECYTVCDQMINEPFLAVVIPLSPSKQLYFDAVFDQMTTHEM